ALVRGGSLGGGRSGRGRRGAGSGRSTRSGRGSRRTRGSRSRGALGARNGGGGGRLRRLLLLLGNVDDGDRLVLAHLELDARRQLHVLDVQRLGDLEAGDVDLDLLGDVGRQAEGRERARDLLEDAARRDALGLADQ